MKPPDPKNRAGAPGKEGARDSVNSPLNLGVGHPFVKFKAEFAPTRLPSAWSPVSTGNMRGQE